MINLSRRSGDVWTCSLTTAGAQVTYKYAIVDGNNEVRGCTAEPLTSWALPCAVACFPDAVACSYACPPPHRCWIGSRARTACSAFLTLLQKSLRAGMVRPCSTQAPRTSGTKPEHQDLSAGAQAASGASPLCRRRRAQRLGRPARRQWRLKPCQPRFMLSTQRQRARVPVLRATATRTLLLWGTQRAQQLHPGRPSPPALPVSLLWQALWAQAVALAQRPSRAHSRMRMASRPATRRIAARVRRPSAGGASRGREQCCSSVHTHVDSAIFQQCPAYLQLQDV